MRINKLFSDLDQLQFCEENIVISLWRRTAAMLVVNQLMGLR